MRRMKLFLAMAAVLVAMLTAGAGPAMAQTFSNEGNVSNEDSFIVAGDEFFFIDDFDDEFFFIDDFDDEFFFIGDFDDEFFFVDDFDDEFFFVDDCPFAGDFEGPVNQFDCFD